MSSTGSMVYRTVALVLEATLAVAALAEAKPLTEKRKVISRTASGTSAGNGALVGATATCPRKTRATGGGFSLPLTSGALAFPYESQKVGQNAWRSFGQVVDMTAPLEPVTMTAYVYCRRGAPKTSTVRAPVDAPKTAHSHFGPGATATCPDNRRMLAGGWSNEPPLSGIDVLEILMVRTEPAGNGWLTDVLSGNGPSSVTSYAYCAKRKGTVVPVVVTAPVQGTVPPPQQLTTATSFCGGKRTMVAGGFSQTHVQGTGYYQPFGMALSGNKWVATGGQAGISTLIDLKSVGLCMPLREARGKGK